MVVDTVVLAHQNGIGGRWSIELGLRYNIQIQFKIEDEKEMSGKKLTMLSLKITDGLSSLSKLILQNYCIAEGLRTERWLCEDLQPVSK